MILSNEVKEASSDAAKDLDPDLFALMRGLTVKITCGAFTGSGVVLGLSGQGTLILTAKHNLEMAMGQDSVGSVAKLIEKTSVSLVADDAGFGEEHSLLRGRSTYLAPIPDAITKKITKVSPKRADLINGNAYDAALMLVGDPEFAGAVKAFLAKGFVRMCTPARKGPYFKIFQSESEVSLATAMSDRAPDGYHLFQFGHGKPRKDPNTLNRFCFRGLAFEDLRKGDEKIKYVAQTSEGHTEVVSFPSADDNTGWSGDSGGPFFVTDEAGDAYLLGVYLGSNFYADETYDGDDVYNNALTLVDSAAITTLIQGL